MCAGVILKALRATFCHPDRVVSIHPCVYAGMPLWLKCFFIIRLSLRLSMVKITGKKRHSIRKSQIEDLFSSLEREIGESASLFRGASVELLETSSGEILYLIDRKPQLMQGDGFVIPTLKGLLEHPFPERRVVVDAGAVSFVINGADVMRPGIISLSEDIVAGRPVQVVEERHKKPLALGMALFDSREMRERKQGKVIKTFHYVGDDLWNLEF